MRQWQLHWPMSFDFSYKKDNKKRLFLLHIEVAAAYRQYSPIYDTSSMVGSVSLWIFGMIFGHQSRMKKNWVNRIYDTFAMQF